MKRVLLVDLWNVFMIQWHAGVNQDAKFPYRTTLERIRDLAQKYDHAAIMTDGGASFRKDIDPRWKKNREEKYAGAVAMLAQVERALAENFPVFKVPHLEADDLIASAVYQMVQMDEFLDGELSVTINSGDKDLLALLEPGVEVLSTNSGMIVRAEDVRQNPKFGVDPPKMRDFLLIADDHNGVKYVRGVGPVNAAALLNTFGDLGGIIAALDTADPANPKRMLVHPPSIREAFLTATRELIGDRPALDVAREIVTLRTDAPIDANKIFEAVHGSVVSEDGGFDDQGPDGSGEVPMVCQDSANEARSVAKNNDASRPQMPARRAMSAPSDATVQEVRQDDLTVPTRWEMSLEPRTAREAAALAQCAHKANFWPKHGTVDGCLLIILAGRSKGIPAFDALNGMHIIEGKPTFGAHLIIGMVRASKVCGHLDLVESDEKHALWVTKRRGSRHEQKSLYTIQMATDAGLVQLTSNGKKSNWQKNPQDMLVKAAGAKLCRWVYQDVTGGFVATEEMEDS